MYEHAYPTKIPVCSVNDRFPYTKRNIIQVNGARQVVITAVLDKVWTSGDVDLHHIGNINLIRTPPRDLQLDGIERRVGHSEEVSHQC